MAVQWPAYCLLFQVFNTGLADELNGYDQASCAAPVQIMRLCKHKHVVKCLGAWIDTVGPATFDYCADHARRLIGWRCPCLMHARPRKAPDQRVHAPSMRLASAMSSEQKPPDPAQFCEILHSFV